MASKPKAEPKPDPATIASSPGEQARKQQELQNRRRGGFYTGFRNIQAGQSANNGATGGTGGGNQTVG